jgi:amino acid permease
MRRVVHMAVLVSGVAYLIVGVFGYLTFLEETEGNIFNNYDNDILVSTFNTTTSMNGLGSLCGVV